MSETQTDAAQQVPQPDAPASNTDKYADMTKKLGSYIRGEIEGMSGTSVKSLTRS
jgi:hypothetical protein